MTYNKKGFTYGVELEYADVYRFNNLPKGSSWNDMDNTIVNSTGIANDPKGKLWEFGGEINTKPTKTIKEQIKVIKEINKVLEPKPVINYRCNLHIHIGIKGLNEDLKALKKLLRYIHRYQKEAFDIVEHIPLPLFLDYKKKEHLKGAMKRYKRRHRSHQHKLSDKVVGNILKAKTPQAFFEEHAPLTDKGRMWFFAPRAGINLRQLFDGTKTIEFRHFPGTLNMKEMKSCLLWCREFVYEALNSQKSPAKIYSRLSKKYDMVFPKFEPYVHEQEVLYELTNVDKNSRKQVAQNLKELKKKGKI